MDLKQARKLYKNFLVKRLPSTAEEIKLAGEELYYGSALLSDHEMGRRLLFKDEPDL